MLHGGHWVQSSKFRVHSVPKKFVTIFVEMLFGLALFTFYRRYLQSYVYWLLLSSQHNSLNDLFAHSAQRATLCSVYTYAHCMMLSENTRY